MEYYNLGQSGIKVSELCFGVLPMGPLQANIPLDQGASIILNALNSGINFLDTAQVYQTYPYIKEALSQFEGNVVIASKSMASNYIEMREAAEEACREMNREAIDLFHLHAPREKKDVFKKREGALNCLVDLKKKGLIRSIGISTHAIEVVNKASEISEIDVVFPIINQAGLGIIGGTTEEMIQAINRVHHAGKGLYAMKALAGGYFISRIEEALNFVRNLENIHVVAVGMVNQRELDMNLKIFNNEKIDKSTLEQQAIQRKKLFVSRFFY